VICAFIASVSGVFGIVPVCRALTAHGISISPRTYHDRRVRPASRRTVRDAWLTAVLAGVFEPDERGRRKPESLYGAVKARAYLRRQGITVARCTVERLMRASGWRGNVRGPRKVVTTVPDSSQDRPGDLVNRDFRAVAPNRLQLVDFTYIATWAGTVYTALVIDAFSRMIVGWRTAGHHRMTLVLDALVMAVAARRREGVTVAGANVHVACAGSPLQAKETA